MNLTDYAIYKSFLLQAKGLMFSRRKTIIFEFSSKKKVSLHTFFVFYPITVLFLDEKKRIVEQAIMKPFSFYWPKKKAKYVVELPFETKTRTGKRVNFE